MELNKIYFYTASIVDWKFLLRRNHYKQIIVQSLSYLVVHNKIRVYGFVIMPNHIHLLWELLEMNGRELPHASFMKYTAHCFLQQLRSKKSDMLQEFTSKAEGRVFEFWQRNALAVHVYSPDVIYQKLEYIHNNPVQGRWLLAESPLDYKFSSANYYETGEDDFKMLSHIGERL